MVVLYSYVENMKVRNLPLILLVLTLLATAIGLGQIILTYQDYPFFFDEAIHANGGLALTVDLWNGDMGSFVRTFYRQGFYPPTFSVPKGFVFYLFGPSIAVARGFSLACLIVALLVLYFFSRRLFVDIWPGSAEQAGWVGLIAVWITLTSLPLLNASTHVMMEAPGLLISIGFLWLYYRTFAVSAVDGTFARPSDADKRGFALTSLALMAVFLTKYTYGLAMVGTVALMELSMLDWRSGLQLRQMGSPFLTAAVAPLRPALNRWLWLIGPFVLCLILWLGTPYKLSEFYGYATAQPNEAQWSWGALAFYPKNLLLQQLPSPLFGAISLLGLIWGWLHKSKPGVRLLLAYFVVGMLEMVLNFPKIPRFLVTFLPAAHMLTGLVLYDWLGSKSRWDIKGKAFAMLLIASLLWAGPVLYGRFSTLGSLMSSQLKTAPSVNEIPVWVDGLVPDGSQFVVVNYFELVNMQSLAWGMVTDGDWPNRPFDFAVMPGALLGEPTAENVSAFREDVLESNAEYVLVIEGSDWGASWPPYDQQLDGFVEYLTHKEFQIDVVDRPEELLWHSLIDWSTVDYVLENERGTFNLKLILYRVNKE